VIPNNNPPAAGAGLPADVTDPESIPDPATDPSAAPLDPATRPETTSPSATEPAKKPVKKPASDPETPKAATSPKAPATRTAEPRPDIAPSAPKPAVPEPTPPAAAPAPADNQTGRHQVLMEGFASRQDAQKTAESLKAQGYKPIVRESNGKAVVQLGTFSNRTNAQSLAEKTGARVQSQTAPNP
jgi:cell division protein FtsN